MGGGYFGGFGHTKGSNLSIKLPSKTSYDSSPLEKSELPTSSSQLNHIFRNKEGHLPKTAENMEKILKLANDPSAIRRKDAKGNVWVTKEENGQQLWARIRNGIINNAGINKKPRSWDSSTGLNKNPFKNKKGGK